MKLRDACKCSLPIEVMNPVDALMSPLNVKTFLERKMMTQLYLFEPETFLHLIAERYTLCKDGIKHILSVNMEAIKSKSPYVMRDLEYVKRLEENADKVLYLKNLNEWNSVFQDYGSKAIRSCYRRVSEKAECVIIEGFNDAVCPDDSLRYDLVIGVAPGVTVFYDAENFHRVIETLRELGKDPRGLRAEDVVKYLKKGKILQIPALPSSCLKDYDELSGKLDQLIDYTLQRVKNH